MELQWKLLGNQRIVFSSTALLTDVCLLIVYHESCLLKYGLHYELSVRRINSEVDVQTLPKLFLSVVSEGVPVDLIIRTRLVLKICMELLRVNLLSCRICGS